MTLRSLSWRIGLPFAAFVLSGSVVLVLLIRQQVASESRDQFVGLARLNAGFLRGANLPRSERLAENLQQILGVQIAFRTPRGFVTARDDALDPDVGRTPADGRVHRIGGHEAVAVPLDDDVQLVLARPVTSSWSEIRDAPTLAVLVAFWVLAALVGWGVGRGLVRPLRNLAARLPQIERSGPLELAEAERGDEIGDVARSFLRTRMALQEEREHSRRAEKLAVLGRMTAALAHEIQNPVAAIKMHAQLWRGTEGDETSQLIEHEASRIDDLLSQWLFLGRPEPPETSTVSLAAVVEKLVHSHQKRLDHARVRVAVDVAEDLRVRGDAKRLSQVFSNVLMNALQAMPRGGVLRIEVSEAGAEGTAEVSFEDSGGGFSDQALARFSEFFFSEKEGGMGIGLSVASAIARAHGGELRVANREEGGARVTILLPRAGGAGPDPDRGA